MSSAAIPAHVSTEASPADRGRVFGAAHAGLVANTVAAYRRLFAATRDLSPRQVGQLGQRVADLLGQTRPRLAEEIAGIADGAGVPERELFAANARTEILAGTMPPECSVIGVLPTRSASRRVLLAQNWDWHPELAASRVLWTVAEPDGTWFSTLTEAGILAKIGLNSSGLGVAINILSCSLDGGIEGMPVHGLLRLLLAECHDLRSAVRLIRGTPVSASSCLTLGWQSGTGAGLLSAEVSPAGPAFVPPDQGILLHTNHFLAGPPSGHDLYPREWPDTRIRLDDLRHRLGGLHVLGPKAIREALRSHAGGPLSVCCHGEGAVSFADRTATLASVMLCPDERDMTVTAGQPCRPHSEAVPAYPPAGRRPGR